MAYRISSNNSRGLLFVSLFVRQKGAIIQSSLNRHRSVLLDQIPLQLDRDGIKEKENGERVGGRLFEGGDYSKYFH